ncbi:ankyrin repeat protein [Pseudozyma hubeiensis SY62]|uniref:Ankyrin repeat protein n=1 Tax=Pseudozyma hubeiensis (strain SY62) TaxID=1305764 RepID=R9PAS7_PSEHS|nr:ankyrin repeat protein [Pseudozyma hubeiensis SY62]GAC98449.1 ankyrin repeat protein [Pseudozyma hubeiensis SY62]
MLRNAVSRTTLKAVGQGGLGGSSSHADGMHPNLGLHSAAATGNIGLVKFALENGQPANSNLNGILPLHAACSGGSEQSVRMLILHGADVNAPRLRAKGSAAGPGAEGSTPLHFAAANGHLEIVRILLEAGARPAAADKEGVTPEALALGAGHIECANLVRSWISAYGSNGLAGMVESRETVSGDVTLGPAGYIRYAASGGSASPLPSTAAPSAANSTPALSSTPQAAVPHSATKSFSTASTSNLTTQSSFDTLPANKSGSLSKTSSNPNLRNQVSSSATPPLPVASPTSVSVASSPHPASASASTIATPVTAATSPRMTTFPSTQQPYEPVSVATAIGSGSVRESKRRPSLPSILEKAAHPAASLRAALASGSSAHTGSISFSQASSVRQPDVSYDANSLSPGKRPAKLAGKRSLSNILRKATGSNPIGSQQQSTPASQHSGSSYADTTAAANNYMLSGGAINMDALAKPGRKAGRPFEHQRPSAASSLRGTRRNTAGDSSAEDQEAWRHVPITPATLSESRTEAGALNQPRTLRSTSSSSSLSAARDLFIADNQRRARAGSNERVTSNSRLPQRANASLDLLRPIGFLGQSDDPTASRKSMDKYRVNSNQNSRIDAIMRAGLALPSASGSTSSSQQAGASSNAPHFASRDRSVSGSSSQSAATTDNDGQTVEETADEDDLQEFLDHSASQTGDSTLDGGERHDSHRLPAGLRTMTALRQQSSRDAGDTLMTDPAAPAHSLVNAPGALQDGNPSHSSSNTPLTRVTRDRSGSHVSAVSSGSQSGHSSRGTDFGQRNSPGLAAGYQAMSIAEENGLTLSAGPASTAGTSISSLSRAGRAPSVTESITSHASSSSLRSNFLSAAEQAQAILNHESPYTSDGPDGTSTSLAAQLAAYGEALAVERKRAGDVRNGSSPALSARGSNAALRSKLPSVSEDQSPSRSASHNSRSFSVSEQRHPNLPATAAQSYNRRVSRRPHSSEGQQDAAKRGTFGSVTTTIGPSTLSATDKARLGLDRSPAPSHANEKVAAHDSRGVSPHTIDVRREGSPLPQHTAQGHAEVAAAPGPSDRPAAAMPTKGQPRRRHEPVTLSSASILPLDTATPNPYATGAAAIDVDDEDDPKTPVLGGDRATMDKFATSTRNLHHHSPSLPTELESYTTARFERLPDIVPAGGSGPDSSTGSAAPPRPPPRKESIHPSGLGLDSPSISSDSQTLTPDSVQWQSWRAEDGTVGRGEDSSTQEKPTRSTSSSRWDGLRRPSLNMLRSVTSSSTNSQTPSHASFSGSAEDHGHSRWSTEDSTVLDKAEQQASSGGSSSKRGLVRNLLHKAKGTS